MPLNSCDVYWSPPKVFREGEGDECERHGFIIVRDHSMSGPVISTRRRTAAMKARRVGSPSSGSPAAAVHGATWVESDLSPMDY